MSFLLISYVEIIELPIFVKFTYSSQLNKFFCHLFIRALARNSSFGFLSVGLCVGKNQMCCLCGGFLSLQRTWLYTNLKDIMAYIFHLCATQTIRFCQM